MEGLRGGDDKPQKITMRFGKALVLKLGDHNFRSVNIYAFTISRLGD